MSGRPVVVLYRPWAPSARAQSIQVLASAHALAAHRPVSLWVRPMPGIGPVRPLSILAHSGLAPRPALSLRVLPAGGTASSLAFRAAVAAWRMAHPAGVGLARQLAYARWAQRLGLPVVLEAHGLHDHAGVEAAAVAGAHGLVCNSEGTLQLLRARHGVLPPSRVVANACRGAGPALVGAGHGIGYVGSVRRTKGLEVLAALSEAVDEPVVMVTPEPRSAHALGGRLRVEGPLAPADVPARLARFRVLVLPLGRGRFADHETCPLKLYDYLASGRPVVVADTPAVRRLVPDWVPRFTPGHLPSLRRALARCEVPELVERFAQRPLVRTWADRAVEIDAALHAAAP